ncbi:hypothetical protein CsSME_00038942 [Camellia sinensis var. sinensis]
MVFEGEEECQSGVYDGSTSIGIVVSMVMKYVDNIVKVYSTSVAMLLAVVVSVFLFGFHLVVSVSVYLHSIRKLQR